jgi:hypothetical protein
LNTFKKNPGVGGLALTNLEGPMPHQNFILYNPSGVPVNRGVYSDEDGWYFISYKHTGKAATYTVEWTDTGQRKNVLLKANGMAQVDFTQ